MKTARKKLFRLLGLHISFQADAVWRHECSADIPGNNAGTARPLTLAKDLSG